MNVFPFYVMLASLVLGGLPSACTGDTESSDARAPTDHRSTFAELVERSKFVSARVEMEVTAVVDGQTASVVHLSGTIIDGGRAFRIEIDGPTSFGLPDSETRPVELLLADGRLLQRGPVIEAIVTEAEGRWVDVGVDTASLPELGLVGPEGFGALDLLDRPGEVEEGTDDDHYRGTLAEVSVGGARVASVDSATFEARVGDTDVLEWIRVEIDSGNGVQLSVELTFTEIGAVRPVELPTAGEIYEI